MANRPNVLMIMLDQLRYDSLGRTSDGRVSTPALDALAGSGAWFDNAYCNLPTCCPARQGLLSARRPESLGALWNFDNALPVASLEPTTPTWPARLHDAGYRSTYFGKWHVSPTHDPTAFGYDRYVNERIHKRYLGERFPDLSYSGGSAGETSPLPVESMAPHWFARQVCDEITELGTGEGPWHVRLDLAEPHLPCRPAARYAERYSPDTIEPWPSFADTFEGKPYIQRQQLHSWGIADWSWDEWAPVVARYFATITQVDDAIGRVLDTLDATGQRDDTIVVVSTDHGDMCGGHRMMDKHYVLYDDVVRVPLIISWPGVIAQQTREEFVYNLLDLGPTLTDVLGLDELPDADGRSLAPLLTGGPPPSDWRDSVVCTYNGQQFGLYTQRALRTSDWKYVWNATDVDELYDLRSDPAELKNVIDESANAEVVSELRQRLHAGLTEFGDAQVANRWVRRQFLENAKL